MLNKYSKFPIDYILLDIYKSKMMVNVKIVYNVKIQSAQIKKKQREYFIYNYTRL